MPSEADTDPQRGLTEEEARRRLEAEGPNTLPEAKPPGFARLFLRQFLSPFIYILLAAAGVSFAFAQIPSGVFILLVLLINAAIGAGQEYGAQRAAAALRAMVSGEARVLRDGRERGVPFEALVRGDVVLIRAGAKVPADLRLVASDGLEVDESMLTGESGAVAKDAGAENPEDAPLSERADSLFAGTVVTRGKARGVVVATGAASAIGRIAADVSGREGQEAPLTRRFRRFTYVVAVAILFAIAALFGVMTLVGAYTTEEMVLMGVGLAVSSIPEGLPAALTVALAVGMNRMAKAKVVIRRLVAVEALGSCTFIGSDKTGTLTVNEITVRRLALPDGTASEVSGEGLDFAGEVTGDVPEDALAELVRCGVLANESALEETEQGRRVAGDMVDGAFLVLARKRGEAAAALRERWPQLREIPYDGSRAYAASLNRGPEGAARWFVKGSAEAVVEMCGRALGADGERDINREGVAKAVEALSGEGFRVLALASGGDPEAREPSGLTLLGFAAMIDPLRPEAVEAVEACRRAGVETAMMTGDHPATATAIARRIGMISGDARAITGRELSAMAPEARAKAIRGARVFARIAPEQKREIVETMIAAGHFVAVTGDGVNDAPALRAAHCGVAMGKRGADVAKETADVVVTDDNFASIVRGIAEGRVVYGNVRKVVSLLIATGSSQILLVFLCAFTATPLPLLPVQLLWLNLVTNGVQDVALGFEPAEGDELNRPPRRPDERIFDRDMIESVLVNGAWMGLMAFVVFSTAYDGAKEEAARNTTLMLMVLFGNVHAWLSRSERRSILRMPLLANPVLLAAIVAAQAIHLGAAYVPWLSDVLALSPVEAATWGRLALIAASLIAVDEALKAWRRRRERAAG